MNLTPRVVQAGVYDGHEYGAKGLDKFRVIKTYGHIWEGTVFDGEYIHLFDGDADLGKFCVGHMSIGPRTFWSEIPAELCEEDEGEEDIVTQIFDKKYAEEYAKDKPGCLPFQFIVLSIKRLERENEESKNYPRNKNADERNRRWLDALHAYRFEHYANVE